MPISRLASKIKSNLLNQRILAILILTACLIPFIGKAFHMDDPMFLWPAQKILSLPLDFYGFTVNWYNVQMPMHQVMQNPPLTSYFIALTGQFFGMNEATLHLSFLLAAMFFSLGIFELARELKISPLPSFFIAVLNPAFLVSATNIMSDVLMLGFWVWSVKYWLKGTNDNRPGFFLLSALFITFAVLTKYTALQGLVLLVVFSLARIKEIRFRVFFLIIPILILIAYDFYTSWLYGNSLLQNAFAYASGRSTGQLSIITSIIFLGGGFISSLFLFPFIWDRKTVFVILSFTLTSIILLSIWIPNVFFTDFYEGNNKFIYLLQSFLMLISGINIVFLAMEDLKKNRNPESILLMLWIIIPLMSTALLNWTVSIRSLLPVAPAFSFLIIRRLELMGKHNFTKLISASAITLSALISIAAAYADYQTANSAKSAAQVIAHDYAGKYNKIIFQGHWGFQYYMERSKGVPFDIENCNLSKGDIVIKPSNNGIVYSFSEWIPKGVLQMESVNWLAVNNYRTGAGFYSSIYGTLPYFFGRIPNEKYFIYEVDRNIFIPQSVFPNRKGF